MRILTGRKAEAAVARIAVRGAELSALEPQVRRIIESVRRDGDRALRRCAERWDGVAAGQPLRVSEAEMAAAEKTISADLRTAIRQAKRNIRQFCRWQTPRSWMRTRNGISLGQVIRPLDSVGCYVPGGRYRLVSTLLMTVIPAQVAGVPNIRVVSPGPSQEVLAAAAMLGVQEFYRVGGAQAIAALAYGTASIPRVDKIVGPGNSYVTSAKKLIAFDCAIDALAGPTEAVVLSHAGNAKFIAADLAAQGEHDPEALSIFITTSSQLAQEVLRYLRACTRENAIARESLQARGAVLLADSRQRAVEWANRIAPEHITVAATDVPFVRNAGSIFVGDYSAQAAGDYASGPNHVLPTGGQARFRGGLSVMDFVKVITVQKLSRPGLKSIAATVECMAASEGLTAHAESVRVRCARA
jgi:histidinol dehydrogenase